MFELITANKRRTVVLVAGFTLAVCLVGAVLGLLVGQLLLGALAGLLVGAGVGGIAYATADAFALKACHARPADRDHYQRLHNLVEGLCVAIGLPKPQIMVIEDPALNALATGRDPKHASLAVTTGLLEQLDRVELEGVVAHELAQIRVHDTLLGTVAATLAARLPLVGQSLLSKLVPSGRDTSADLAAAAITRYPPGLIAALEKLRAGSTVVRGAKAATAHLWICTPVADGSADGLGTPLEQRIALLREM